MLFEISAFIVSGSVPLARSYQRKSHRRNILARHRAIRAQTETARTNRPDPNEPRDAIPAGYPGFRGSIRYIPASELRACACSAEKGAVDDA